VCIAPRSCHANCANRHAPVPRRGDRQPAAIPPLKDRGRAAREGRLAPADYCATLEQEIARVVARQEDIGLPVVTDGELARSSWFGFCFGGLEGFRLEPSHFKFKDAHGSSFDWPTCVAAGQIRRRAPITLEAFERAPGLVRRALVKTTMPAPSALHFFLPSRPVG
jgi:5-methyltetrahydropteroyltriglutamate--homocysteine methyltransferase